MPKVCHITTVHAYRYDVRIFQKECKSLAKAGYEVHLIVADGKGNEVKDNIKIWDLGKPKNRLERILKYRKKALKKALQINADLYHFHDPELIPVGLKLKKLGKKVIYDIHEDLPRQILHKSYLSKPVRIILSKIFKIYENNAAKKFDSLFTAVPVITNRFIKINSNTVEIRNYPKLEEFQTLPPWEKRLDEICYVGGISEERGIIKLLDALEFTKPHIKLNLAGKFYSEEVKQKAFNHPQWQKVNYYGYVDRKKLKEILAKSKIGLVTLLPTPNHLISLPIKFFEYMGAGLAVVSSNFETWNEFAKDTAITVDPTKPKEIANAINYLFENQQIAKQMGEKGFKLVREKYNWETQEKKLLEIYQKLLSN